MNYLDKASLIMIPSAYGEGKLACVKPTDGSGDFNFTRNSSALRTNPSGVLETACYNLLTQSEGNISTYPARVGVVDAPISIVGFDNSIQFGDNSVLRYAYKNNYTPTIGVIYNLSFFIQMDDGGVPVIGSGNDNGDFLIIYNGEAIVIDNTTIDLITGSIYRVSGFKTSNTNSLFGILKFTTQSARKFKISGIQLTEGADLKPYQKTTDRLNVPRLDYSGGATCPSVLIEPQRTNIITNSENFTAWLNSNIIVNSNSIVSPTGILNAAKLVENTVNGEHFVFKYDGTIEIRNNSIFAKIGERDKFILHVGATSYLFDLTNETATPYSNGSSGTPTILKMKNGWYRCSLQLITTSNNTFKITLANSLGQKDYLGDGVSGMYFFGAQSEYADYATSYIPTAGTAVTRIADNVVKTGISNLIGQTEGTIYAEININKDLTNRPFTNILTLQNNIFNFLNLYILSSSLGFRLRKDSGSITTTLLKNIELGVTKIAVTYTNGNYKLFLNGVLVSSSTNSLNYPTGLLDTVILSDVNFASNNYPIKNIMLFKTKLTDQECMDLTTI